MMADMARPADQWYPTIAIALAANLVAALVLGTWVSYLNPGLSPLLWFMH